MQATQPISLEHFTKLMGPYGLYQHATKREPNLAEGYCVDDNARAIIVLLAYLDQFPAKKDQVEKILQPCFAFIQDAHHAPGTYYNFRDAQGTWLTHDVSEDMYARLARMYTFVIKHDSSTERVQAAQELLADLVPTLQTLTAPRAQAETIIALADYPELASIVETHTENLLTLWKKESSVSWPWFEASMTYANALLPHGLLASSSKEAERALHESAAFLIHTTIKNNIFMPIGNMGWYPKGGVPALYDQQAIEGSTMFDFLLAYQAKFPENVSPAELTAPHGWFHGQNTKNIAMADPTTGACLDGLNLGTPNQNYGAESMLAYLWAELLMRSHLKS